MLVVHCFHNNLQLHYISLLFSSRRRAEKPIWDRTAVYYLLSFQSW